MRRLKNQKQGLIDLCSIFPTSGLTMVEIGSYSGESAEIFANSGKFSKIICIDPWQDIVNKDPGNSYSNMSIVERTFDLVAKKFNSIIKFKGTVDTFVCSDLFKIFRNSIDFVYIDGIHTYRYCKNDICQTMQKIKPRIAIGGHDYTTSSQHVLGVIKAVDEVFKKPDICFCDTSWLKFV